MIDTTNGTPEFITAVRNGQRNADQALRMFPHIRHTDLYRTGMRSFQIIRAFYKNKSIRSVESGDMNNRQFALAVQDAIHFMRNRAESEYNKQFDVWLKENLAGTKIEIVETRKTNRMVVI